MESEPAYSVARMWQAFGLAVGFVMSYFNSQAAFLYLLLGLLLITTVLYIVVEFKSQSRTQIFPCLIFCVRETAAASSIEEEELVARTESGLWLYGDVILKFTFCHLFNPWPGKLPFHHLIQSPVACLALFRFSTLFMPLAVLPFKNKGRHYCDLILLGLSPIMSHKATTSIGTAVRNIARYTSRI